MSESDKVAFMVTLHGVVQGIGLRKRICEAAQACGVTGWVRNRAAGHVQAHVEGDKAEVRKLLSDIQFGLTGNGLESAVTSSADVQGFTEFKMIRLENRTEIQESLLKSAVGRAQLLNLEFHDLARILIEVETGEGSHGMSDLCSLAIEIPSRFIGEPTAIRAVKKSLPFEIVDICGSFSSEVWAAVVFNKQMKLEGVSLPGQILNNKQDGINFAKSAGIRVPQTFQSDVGIEEIEFRPGMALKPTTGSGSKGVYCVYDEDRILNVVKKIFLNSYDKVLDDIGSDSGPIAKKRRWMSEELIQENGKIANDVKVYCFYGKAALALEVNRTGSAFRYCWWGRDCQSLTTGKYLNKPLDGTIVSDEYFAAAEHLSALVPLPFMRIDFLKSETGPVFGEFTPRPGNFHDFDARTDAWLGRCYAEARGRLMADLMKGKRFAEYEAFVASLTPAKQKKKRKPSAT